jgi:predicted DCC family thiol-disulfide oxidoreductase YuxK
MKKGRVQIVYDKQCPACHLYCRLAEAAAGQADVTLVDAREDSELMTEITRRGMDIDDGMVVEVEDELHYGADAIHMLAQVGDERGLFGRGQKLLFRSRRLAHLLYPLLRAVRNFLLKVLGVRRINNLGLEDRDRF